MKKSKIFLVVLLLVTTILAACGSKEEEAKTTTKETTESVATPEKITFGYVPSAGILQVLYIVAKEKQLFETEFKDDGIELEHRNFQSGPVLIEAMKGNSIDIGHVGDQPYVQAVANGSELTAISLHSIGDKNYGLVVPEGSDIKSSADLKGKKVAVTLGSIGHRILDLYLTENGYTMADVEAVNIPPADIKNTLAAKNVDAAIIWEPMISQIEQENIGKQIANTEGLKRNVNTTVATSAFVEKYPEVTQRIVDVYKEALTWVQENPEEAAKIVAEDTGFEEKMFYAAMLDEEYIVDITEEAIVSIEDTTQFLFDNEVIRDEINIRDFIDTSFTK